MVRAPQLVGWHPVLVARLGEVPAEATFTGPGWRLTTYDLRPTTDYDRHGPRLQCWSLCSDELLQCCALHSCSGAVAGPSCEPCATAQPRAELLQGGAVAGRSCCRAEL